MFSELRLGVLFPWVGYCPALDIPQLPVVLCVGLSLMGFADIHFIMSVIVDLAHLMLNQTQVPQMSSTCAKPSLFSSLAEFPIVKKKKILKSYYMTVVNHCGQNLFPSSKKQLEFFTLQYIIFHFPCGHPCICFLSLTTSMSTFPLFFLQFFLCTFLDKVPLSCSGCL